MSERFYVVNQEYVNTGGGCMVYVADVYDQMDNAVRYFICNEEGFNWQTANTVLCEGDWLNDDELLDKIVLGTWNWDALTTEPAPDQHQFDEDEFLLFKDCQLEYIKRSCKYFNSRIRLSVDQLPGELFDKLTPNYIEWLTASESNVVTNGYEIFVHDEYEEYLRINAKENDSNYQQTVKFKNWLDTVKYEPLEGHHFITITIADKTTHIPFHADSYECLEMFIRDTIKYW